MFVSIALAVILIAVGIWGFMQHSSLTKSQATVRQDAATIASNKAALKDANSTITGLQSDKTQLTSQVSGLSDQVRTCQQAWKDIAKWVRSSYPTPDLARALNTELRACYGGVTGQLPMHATGTRLTFYGSSVAGALAGS